uniref:Replication protein A subunit n=1 Tax=Astyanax mexicanus TaxID=7994 RepID=A0A8B9LLE0_ASTMX
FFLTVCVLSFQLLIKGSEVSNPVLQCVNIRKIDGGSGPVRFRLMMSDGLHTMSSFMLSTQLNYLAEQSLVAPNCVCTVKRSVTNVLKDGRPVVIILDMEVIKPADQVGGKIGDPTPYVEGQSKPPQPAPAPAPSSRPLQPQNGSDGHMNRGPSRDFGRKPMNAPNTPSGTSKIVPIASLNPYQSKWTIRARVTNKSAIRTWSNSRGDGKLFSMEIVDEIEVRKVYYISKGSLKIANKQYTSLKNDYEMTLNGESTIIPCEDSQDVPMVQCDFVAIADLEAREKDAIVDVIGVCKSVEDVMRITTKNSREVSKRNIQLMDMSGRVIQVTMWGNEAETFDGSGQPILAIKGARLSDFGGRSLSTLYSSTLMINPDIPEALNVTVIFSFLLIYVLSPPPVSSTQADYFTCIGTIVYMRKENCLYQACPSKDCNKKVVDQQNGMFRCEKCDKEFPDFKYRLMLSANIADFGDNQWVTCFQDSAETLLGQKADYIGQLKESNEAAFDEVFQHANFNTFVFRNRVKLETYNDESRIKVTVMEAKPVDHKEYSKRLIMNIRKAAAQ